MTAVSSGLSGWFDDTANRLRVTTLPASLRSSVRTFAIALHAAKQATTPPPLLRYPGKGSGKSSLRTGVRRPSPASIYLLASAFGRSAAAFVMNRLLNVELPAPMPVSRTPFLMSRSITKPTTASAAAKPSVRSKDRDPVASGMRDAAFNRSASFNYFLSDRFECGVALRGTEVKSIREGKANLKDAYGLLKDGECFLLNAHIGPFSHGNTMNHESLRTRKLLLHRREIARLEGLTKQKGYTLIPVKLYFRHGRVKCELALAKGKQDWDKRETERNREADREAKAAIARSQRR